MKQILFVVAGAFALAACGGGGGGGPSASISVSGTTTVKELNNNVITSMNQKEIGSAINGKTSISIGTTGDGTVSYKGEAIDASIKGNHTIYANGKFSESSTITLKIDGTKEYDYDSGTWSASGNTVKFDGTYDTTWKIGEKHTEYKQYNYGTETVGGNITFDATLLPNIDVVKNGGVYESNFFITNIATGTKDYYNYTYGDTNLTNYAKDSKQITDIKAAHAAGWTGKGTDIVIGNDAYSGHDMFIYEGAPGARVFYTNTYNSDGYAVGKSASSWSHDHDVYTTDKRDYAVAASLVLHKYDTLKADQAGQIVNNTSNNGTANIANALSPVGNMN